MTSGSTRRGGRGSLKTLFVKFVGSAVKRKKLTGEATTIRAAVIRATTVRAAVAEALDVAMAGVA